MVVGRRFVWDAREGWTREARRRRAWDGGGRYIVSREVRVKCVCARARARLGGGRWRRVGVGVNGAAKVGEGANGATGGVGEEDGVG